MNRLNDASPSQWDAVAKENNKVISDGGSSEYYMLPASAKDLDDLIIHKNMPWHIANIFKACYRYGEKAGHDKLYDCKKIGWFQQKEKEHLLAGGEHGL
jgi:hypothetical protein